MKINNVKYLLATLNTFNLEDAFASIVLFEKGGFAERSLSELTEEDIKKVEKIYNAFMRNDNCTTILNEDLVEMYDNEFYEYAKGSEE